MKKGFLISSKYKHIAFNGLTDLSSLRKAVPPACKTMSAFSLTTEIHSKF